VGRLICPSIWKQVDEKQVNLEIQGVQKWANGETQKTIPCRALIGRCRDYTETSV
jgi:hypothetical protein